MVRVY